MMKKSFSILEIIFAIVIIVVISSFAINKYLDYTKQANFLKIKSELALINSAINQLYANQTLLGNDNFILNRLDDADINTKEQNLFNGYEEYILLDEAILSTNENDRKLGYWIKLSNSEYRVYFTKDNYVDFYFDNEKNLFSCDENTPLCKELQL